MEINSIKIVKKIILMGAIVGFASVSLTGCGIGYCPYTHNYNGGHQFTRGRIDADGHAMLLRETSR
jgi:hypothetical protein